MSRRNPTSELSAAGRPRPTVHHLRLGLDQLFLAGSPARGFNPLEPTKG